MLLHRVRDFLYICVKPAGKKRCGQNGQLIFKVQLLYLAVITFTQRGALFSLNLHFKPANLVRMISSEYILIDVI